MHVESNGNLKNTRIPEKVSTIKLKHGQHILTGDVKQKYPIRTSKTKNFDEVTVVSGILCPLKTPKLQLCRGVVCIYHGVCTLKNCH